MALVAEALEVLASGGSGTAEVVALTLRVAASGLLGGLLVGVPLGTLLALGRFPGRRVLLGVANAGMGLPPVLAGLLVALLLWRSGPLGGLELIYTPAAMILAQALIATPIVIALTASGIQQLGEDLPAQLRALGASRSQLALVLLREARLPLVAAAMAAAGRLIAEVGAAMMVGGNLRGETRTLTTAMVMEVRQGRFALALSLGMALLLLSLLVNGALTWLQQRRAS